VEEKNQQSFNLRYVLLLTTVAALGGLLFGYDTGVISGAIGFLTSRFHLNADATGWAASSALVGCILGASFAGILSDWRGRKKALLLSAVLFTISAISSAVANNLTQFALARMIGGFGVGAASMLSPLYIAEISPAHVRGRLVSLNQLAIVVGFLVVYFVNALVAHFGDQLGGEAWNIAYGWRWMFGSETLPALLFFVLLLFVPESPRWLSKQGREGEALAILTRVNGEQQARIELSNIMDAIAHEQRSLLQLFKPGIRFALMIGILLAIFQQVTGINAVLYYMPEIFKSTGLSSTTAIYQTVIVGAVNLLFTLIAIRFIDQFGRKRLLLIGISGMAISLTLLGSAFLLKKFAGPWVLLFVITYVASFAAAMGPVVWVILSEIFPTRIRGTAMSIATVFLWTANFAVTQFFPKMLQQLQGKSFFVYAAMCVLAFTFVLVFIPETKGKTLEEIEKRWIAK